MAHFVKDVADLRRRALDKMEDGPVTRSYQGDVSKTVEILNEALATEIVRVLRYMHHYFMATQERNLYEFMAARMTSDQVSRRSDKSHHCRRATNLRREATIACRKRRIA